MLDIKAVFLTLSAPVHPWRPFSPVLILVLSFTSFIMCPFSSAHLHMFIEDNSSCVIMSTNVYLAKKKTLFLWSYRTHFSIIPVVKSRKKAVSTSEISIIHTENSCSSRSQKAEAHLSRNKTRVRNSGFLCEFIRQRPTRLESSHTSLHQWLNIYSIYPSNIMICLLYFILVICHV